MKTARMSKPTPRASASCALCLTPSSAFTLVELLISAAIMSLILAAGYACFYSGISSQKLVESRVDVFQSARVAMALMTADLRSACPLSKEILFLGMDRMVDDAEADNLDFATHHYTPRRTGEGDFCQVSYFLARESGSGQFSLWRRRNPTISLDPLSGGKREELARGVRGLRFEYYDGLEWHDEWGDAEGRGKAQTSIPLQPNVVGIPEAVRITLWFDAKPPPSRPGAPTARENAAAEPPLVFQTVARLNLAPLYWTAGAIDPASRSQTPVAGQSQQRTSGGGIR